MPTLHKIDWGFLRARTSGLHNIEDEHYSFTGAAEPSGFLLKEDGEFILLETGDKIVLEGTP